MDDDARVHQQDFATHAAAPGDQTPEDDYFGAGASATHPLQENPVEAHEGYTPELYREDSRTLLQPTALPYTLPPGMQAPTQQSTQYQPQPVQYPPSRQAATPMRPARDFHTDFTTVPLNDQQSSGNAGFGKSAKRKSKHNFLRLGGGDSTSTLDDVTDEKQPVRPTAHKRKSSWDVFGDGGRPEWEAYNPAHAKKENLRFAEGDAGTNPVSRMYLWLLNRGIIVRWFLYITPILALLWIPGIVGCVLADGDPRWTGPGIWGTRLLWWSIWLSIAWLTFWSSAAFFMIFPHVFRQTIAAVIPSLKQYTEVVKNLGRYARLVVWSLINWVSFQPIIRSHCDSSDESGNSTQALILKMLLGILFGTMVLGVEKLIVQLIAFQFHKDSYADRLEQQKFEVKALTALYINSHDIPGRSDTLVDSASGASKGTATPKVVVRKALRGVKSAAQSATTVFGNVASEMTGSSALQTNSPSNKVKAALGSSNKSRSLARRLYYSFRQPGVDHLTIADIARFFPNLETAERAFAIFDRDQNGDATRDEIDEAVMNIHRDRLALEASMRDIDGAVKALDHILMAVVCVIDVLILAAMVFAKLQGLVTSTGAFILSLSWMIGTTMQEILLACIFLFAKHPYDVGDRVDIDGKSYTVAKMELLSTSFRRVDGKYVWIGHNILATKVIENVRRSGATSETFTFDVAFDTSFEKLQALRARMLKFCKTNQRDFLPVFDVCVEDFPDQKMMSLSADIRYKSNWQQGALKVERRNKWVCQLKMVLFELKIWGPADAGNPKPVPADPTRYTLVPWEEVQEAEDASNAPPMTTMPTANDDNVASLVHRRNDSSLDIWGENQAHLYTDSLPPSRYPSPGPSVALSMGLPAGFGGPGTPSGEGRPSPSPPVREQLTDTPPARYQSLPFSNQPTSSGRGPQMQQRPR